MNELKNRTIVWLRNDLRSINNEALSAAIKTADEVLPIYCIDPRMFADTRFGFRKTDYHRAKFLLESLQDLRFRLRDLGGDLVVRTGKPEEIIFGLAKYHQVRSVYVQEEVCPEEQMVEDKMEAALASINLNLYFFWGSTLYHLDDLPYSIDALPAVFSDFRKATEAKCTPRAPFQAQPFKLIPGIKPGEIPALHDLGFQQRAREKKAVLNFKGGETNALLRLKSYLWDDDLLKNYKETRNGLLGADYSSKLSPWLSLGCISPATIFQEVKKYEEQRVKNKSTYWLIFELLWRDYFRFVAFKEGPKLFQKGGIKGKVLKARQDPELFEKWCSGMTGVPFIDANMRELKFTGFMSNRGRQNVASFLVNDLKLDWRMGAAWFESQLVDYDPASNYGNWNYIAGIGNDPREGRYFHPVKQAKRYDPNGDYVKYWIPQLSRVPSAFIHEPHKLTASEQQFLGWQLDRDYWGRL